MQFDGEDITNHPFIKTLADVVPNLHWVYHVAEQLLDVEKQETENEHIRFNWNHRNVDMMFTWDETQQGFDFWSAVNAIEYGQHEEDTLPWMVNGKLQFAHRDKVL